jgi:protein-S-isoprenylcysteine O-methyltransferase Ste14
MSRILIALQLEERDLVALHGEQYRVYRKQAGMLLPLPRLPVVPAQPRR